MKPKILVTGIAGFIGSHVAQACLDQGFEVVGVDDLSGGFMENVPKGSAFIQESIVNDEAIEALFRKHRFDYVFHLAAYAAEGLSHFIRQFNYKNNLLGSINLINSSIRHQIKCFVFTSSIAVYGKNQLPMTEQLVPQPEDPYGISKYAVELDLKAAHEMFGLNYIVFRPHNVYGELQNIADKYRNVIGIFMQQTLSGKPMSVFGDGMQTRAFSYIGDISGTIARSVSIPKCYGETFNIGADQQYTILELAQEVAKAFDNPAALEHLPARKEVQDAYASHKKLVDFFGPQPNTSLTVGIQRMAEWVKKVGPRDSIKFKNIEVEKNLPPSWAQS